MNVRPEYNFKTIGRNLKNLRRACNLTVEDVREYMQLGTVQAIYKWERGEGLPQADSLMALMHLYGADRISTIIGGSEELPSFLLPLLNYALNDICLFYE